jgi:hypothetical protein
MRPQVMEYVKHDQEAEAGGNFKSRQYRPSKPLKNAKKATLKLYFCTIPLNHLDLSYLQTQALQ